MTSEKNWIRAKKKEKGNNNNNNNNKSTDKQINKIR